MGMRLSAYTDRAEQAKNTNTNLIGKYEDQGLDGNRAKRQPQRKIT